MESDDSLIDLLHELVANGRFDEARNLAERIRTNDTRNARREAFATH